MQQILLHQKLKEDIEKNSAGRIRYVDSELYLRNNSNNNNNNYHNQGRSPAFNNASEVQIPNLNVGIINNNLTDKQSSSKIPVTALPTTTTTFTASTATNDLNNGSEIDKYQNDRFKSKHVDTTSSSTSNKINKNCQVCLIKEVRQDLVNINKIVQERNEQITKLKDKCLRSYFERQMID